METKLIDFIEKFFRNLGASILFESNGIVIFKVPESFEKFYGKKSPYKFVFRKQDEVNDFEFVDKTTYIIKAISSYLENSGQTTLLKIDFKIDPIEKITKALTLDNAKLVKLDPKKRHNFFFRFTFHTTFQYINENEKSINDIYVFEGKIIDGDLSSYPVLEGNKDEIKVPDMKEAYFIAKDELKKRIESKTEEIAQELNSRLDVEKDRIESHFLQELKEHKENLEKSTKKLIEIGREGDMEKISKQKKLIESLREKTNVMEFERDKLRAIQLEKQKHMLNVNNKLFNTTLIYYPLFTHNATIKNAHAKKVIEFIFDPISDEVKPIACEICEGKTKKISLCSNEHVVCEKCSSICESCHKVYCKKCVHITCEICSKNICKECSVRCFRCSKVVCKNHTKKDKITGNVYCNKCLKHCERCSNLKDPTSFKLSKRTNAPICEECYRNEMQKGVLKGVFED